MSIVLGLGTFVVQASFVSMQHNIVILDFIGKLGNRRQINRLRNVVNVGNATASINILTKLKNGLCPRTIEYQIGLAVAKNARAQPILPIIIVCKAAHRGFDASQDDGNIGIQLLQNLRINNRWILGTAVMSTVGAIFIDGSQTPIGRIFVHHRIHAARRNTKKQPRPPQLFKITIVAMPIGLRHDGHAIARSL